MLKIYNSLSKKKETFKPIEGKKVGLYSCGPTVYDYAHLGNFRAYVFVDILKKYLQYSGYVVNHVMNLTDVDDKTIKRSQAEKVSLAKLTQKYEKAFLEDLEYLHIAQATEMPKATNCIDDIVQLVEKLLEKGFAYRAEDGSVYFSISKVKHYGKLADLEKQELRENAQGRMQSDEYEKENARDFALWKAYTKEDGDVFWETSLGKGRPGWHIECSAMSMKYLGESFDIHTGGIDLMFPHHTNEIAQSEAATEKPFVKYWMHNEHLLVNGKKMSKSLGNFYTLRDLQEKGYSGRELRYLLARVDYRQKLDFKEDLAQEVRNILEKFDNFVEMLESCEGKGCDIEQIIQQAREHFETAMNDDFDVHHALTGIFDFMKRINALSAELSNQNARDILNFLKKIDGVLGFIFWTAEKKELNVSGEQIEKMIEDRNEAKKNKDFTTADKIRDELAKKGIELIDTKDGTKYKVK